MEPKIKLALTEKDRAMLERSNRRVFGAGAVHDHGTAKTGVPGRTDTLFHPKSTAHKKAAKPEPHESARNHEFVQMTFSDENTLGPALDLLLEGMRKGNSSDKEAVEHLLKSARNKRVSGKFYERYVQLYKGSFREYQACNPAVSAVCRLTSNIAGVFHEGGQTLGKVGKEIAKATQRIFFDVPSPAEDPGQA